jgi:hypothetical protein
VSETSPFAVREAAVRARVTSSANAHLIKLRLQKAAIRVGLRQRLPVQLLDLPNFLFQLLRLGARIAFETVILFLKFVLLHGELFSG